MKNKRMLLKAIGTAAMMPTFASAEKLSRSPASEQYFPDVPVETHDGRKLRFYSDLMEGKTVVFNMMYTACTRICPPNTASLMSVHEALGDRIGREIFMYSLTLQPEIDTPAALMDYAKRYGTRPGWTFLRAKRADLEVVRRKLGFFNTDPQADADISKHTGMIRVGNVRKDRWFMVPALSPTRQIVSSILNV